MSRPLNTSDIKKTNRRLVLDTIYRFGTTSRTQLAKELSMSKPAISDNLSILLESGLVEEVGESSVGPSGGRKQILLQFNAQNRYIISIDLSSNSVIFALSDLVGNILNTFEIFVTENTPAASCLELLYNGIRVLQQAFAPGADNIYCIAVAAPGSYDEDGHLLSCNAQCGCPPWYQIDLQTKLSETFQMPVIVYNNIKAATIGEWVNGSCQHESNMLYLSTGLGIGAGILLNGEIFAGENFDAGEIYDYIDSDSPAGSGNFEDCVCLKYLTAACAKLPDAPFPNPKAITIDQITDALHQEHPGVCKIVNNICRRLAVMVYNQLNFISVHLVCFAGEYAPFYDCFRAQLNQLFANSTRPVPDVRETQLGKFGSTTGLIHLARQRYFNEICSK